MFVDNALDKNALGFQEEFQTKIAEKITDALEAKKADVARQMFDEEFQAALKKKLTEDKWLQHAVHPSRAGMFDGVSVDTIRHELENLRKTGPHAEGSPQHTKMAQLEFALRAKTKHGFQNEATEHEKKVAEKDKKRADKDAKKLTTEGNATPGEQRLAKSAMRSAAKQGVNPYDSHKTYSKTYKKLFALRGNKR